MVVADVLMPGSDAGYLNVFFKDYYMSKFFKKSFEALKPDMVLVLGDVSAKGYNLTKRKWLSVIWQFRRMVGPFLDLIMLSLETEILEHVGDLRRVTFIG